MQNQQRSEKIGNVQVMGEPETQHRLQQALQLDQIQRKRIPVQSPHSLSWLFILTQDRYEWGSDQIQKDLLGKVQMLKDFIELGKQERESVLISLKIIIRRINNREQSAVYQVFLEQLEKKQKQIEQAAQKKLKLLQILLGTKCYILITALFVTTIFFIRNGIDITQWEKKQIGIFIVVMIAYASLFFSYKWQQRQEQQKKKKLREQEDQQKKINDLFDEKLDRILQRIMRLKQRVRRNQPAVELDHID